MSESEKISEKKSGINVYILKSAVEADAILKSRDNPMERLDEESLEYYDPPYDPQDLVDLMSVSTTHARCVKAKAADAAGIGYKIIGSDPDVEPSKKSIKKIRDFVRHVHRRFDLCTILEEAVKDRESIGWSATEVIRNNAGKVSRLVPVPAHSIRVVRKDADRRAAFVQISDLKANVYFQEFPDKYKDGRPNFIGAKEGKDTRRRVKGSATELIFWQKPHTSVTRWYGVPDIIPSSGDVAAVRQIRDRFLKFFDNNCIPRHAITLIGSELTPEARRAIEEFFRASLEKDPHKTLILASDDPDFSTKFDKVEAEQLEADYRETRKDLRDFIRLAHGIPPAILGIEGGTSKGAGSGLSQAEIYVNRIITPIQRGLHKILDNIVEFGLGITDAVIRLDAPDIRDLNLEMRRNTQYISHGVFSINDVLKTLGMPKIKGGDKHHIWSRRTQPKIVGVDTGEEGTDTGAGTESEGGGGGGAVSDMNRA